MSRRPVFAAVLAAATMLLAPGASAVDLPARKTGLWETSIALGGRSRPPQVTLICLDAATEKLSGILGNGLATERCSKREIRASGGGYVVDSVCKGLDRTTTSHTVITGDFARTYTVKVSSTPEGGPTTEATIEGRFLGPCKPGQQPGDLMKADGTKMLNVRDVKGR